MTAHPVARDAVRVDRTTDAGAGPHHAPGHYVVSLRGCISEALADAFHPLVATTGSGRTLLRGPIEDQAALYGVLAKIQSLGLELDELRHDLPTGTSVPPG